MVAYSEKKMVCHKQGIEATGTTDHLTLLQLLNILFSLPFTRHLFIGTFTHSFIHLFIHLFIHSFKTFTFFFEKATIQ